MLSGEIKEKLVYSKDMVIVGRVKELELDPAEMKLTSLIVEFEKEVAKDLLGKASMIGRDEGKISTELIEKIGKDAIILKQGKDELKV